MDSNKIIDITKPLWDQRTFLGRYKHFAFISNPMLCLVSKKELSKARILYLQYKYCKKLPYDNMDRIIKVKQIYESAYHPDSGELQHLFGRMCFQAVGGCLITGGMLQWHKSVKAVVFWQWVNQSLNALVNYTNRNADSPLTITQMGVAYVSATTAALCTALWFKFVIQKTASHPIMTRFVPYFAIASANWVNLPLVRQNEIRYGLHVMDENRKIVGMSQIAPVIGISQVVISRIFMSSPAMLLLPFIMEYLEKKPWMQRIKWTHGAIQIAFVGVSLIFMVPAGCAIFPQRCQISTEIIKQYERENYEKILRNTNGVPPEYVYINKGL